MLKGCALRAKRVIGAGGGAGLCLSWPLWALLAVVVAWWPCALLAQDAEPGAHSGTEAGIAQPADPTEGVTAARSERVWAEVGLTQNPVAFCIGPDGSVYVAESARAGQAVSDTRQLGRLNGVEEDLRMTSVEDRLAQIERWTANGDFEADYFTRTEDRVRVVRDTDGDGVADESAVYAGGFNDPLDGIGAGVLWLDGGLFYTCIPHVWRLEDKDGDGDADEASPGERTSLSYGYGIRWAFYGHDLHGLTMGPDGRIYFSMGDRGFNVETQEGETLRHVERGAVLRMWPDGSELEVFHVGLRNPQELAFDCYGNLYTGDNNCDAGDKARFVHLVEGGDSGWHQDVQSLPDRGPWLREKMWELRREDNDPTQPAWIIPPIAHIGHGPSGLAHYPGTGDSYPINGSFLMADFPGGVRHIVVEPDGAWSRVAQGVEMAVSGKDVTDVCWGYDGRVYLSEWGGGWGPNPNGYIFTMTNDAVHADADAAALIAEVQTLFAEGFEQRSDDELIALLGHADQRVRLHAQYEVAKRDGVAEALGAIAQDVNATQMQRIHAAWTLGMIARREPSAADAIAPLLTDTDPHVRTQAAKTLGDLRYEATEQYIAMLEDDHAQARFYAAIALGKTSADDAIGPLLDMLVTNNNKDLMLRHAGSYALALIGDTEAMLGVVRDSNPASRGLVPLAPAGRLGVVLALRHNADPALSGFLYDRDPLVAAEAVRAIYDQRVAGAIEDLASMRFIDPVPGSLRIEPILRRVIEANAQLGGAEQADRLARLAADADYDAKWRMLAMQELDGWDQIKNREGVWGHWRPRAGHDVSEVSAALTAHIDVIEIAAQGNDELATLVAAMRLKHVTESTADELAIVTMDADSAALLRRTAADKLADLFPDSDISTDSLALLADDAAAPDDLKNHARALLAQIDPDAAVRSYVDALAHGSTTERQEAITQLAELATAEPDGPAADAIAKLSQQLKRGELDPALRLEAYAAIAASPDTQVAGRAADYATRHPDAYDGFVADTLLAGGDVERGRAIAHLSEIANCLKCHTFGDESGGLAGSEVGPNLQYIGSAYTPGLLLQALADPSASIAPGYQTTALTLLDGTLKSGRILNETATTVSLADSEGNITDIPADQVVKRVPSDTSMMPAIADRLSPHELRDLIAYLAARQDPARGPATAASVAAGTMNHGGAGHAGPGIYNPLADLNNAVVMPFLLLILAIAIGGYTLLVYFLNLKG